MRLLVIRKADELTVKGRAVLVIKTGNRLREIAVRDIDAVLILGSKVKIRSSVPPVLSLYNKPLSIVAKDSISILINPIGTKYNNYRRLQYLLDKISSLEIALEYIKSKIAGMKNILKYYKRPVPEIKPSPERIDDPNLYEEEIRIWEAVSSQTLWSNIIRLIRDEHLKTLTDKYGFIGRKPRHQDPFNKTLSVMYAVLYTLATKALISAGLDPTYGFLHRTRYSTPLVFDYTEMFKPIAIQATIELINNDGLPELGSDGELERDSVNKAIRTLYNYLTMKHKHTGKTPYQYIYLKAYRLAKYLEGKSLKEKLTIIWNRAEYKTSI